MTEAAEAAAPDADLAAIVQAGELVWYDVGELRPHPKNYRRGDVDAVRASIRRNGFVGVVYVQAPRGNRKRPRIFAGEHRWRGAKAEGIDRLPCWQVDIDDATAERMLAADNLTSDRATNDPALLAGLMVDIAGDDPLAGLEGTGMSAGELEGLLAGLDVPFPAVDPTPKADPVGDVDAIPEPPKKPIAQAGDLWLLGDHRVLCADSLADTAAVARLLDGDRVACVVTDPPYAIYGSSTGVASDIADDAMVRPFFALTWDTIRAHLAEFGHAYVHCDWRSWASIWETCGPAGMAAKNMIVWDKGGSGLGSNYANTHELVFFAHHLPPSGTMTSGRKAGIRSVNGSNVFRYNRPTGEDRQHNAAKPVEMAGRMIENSTEPGDVVLDLFAGSGSTLIACEETGRAARVADKKPVMVDIICRRWQLRTGERPVLASTGKARSFA